MTSIALTLAYLAAWLYDGRGRDWIVTIAVVLGALLLSVMTFARTPVFMLVVGVTGILWFRGRAPRPVLVGAIGAALAIALIMGFALGKGLDESDGFLPLAIIRYLGQYFVGGPSAFAEVMANPARAGDHGLSLRFFTQPLASFGVPIRLPDNVLRYVALDLGNVYTAHFAYWLDGRWIGVAAAAALSGAVATFVHLRALQGRIQYGVALGMVYGALLNTAVIDGFFGSAVPWLLILAVTTPIAVLGERRPPVTGGDIVQHAPRSDGPVPA